MKNNLKQKEDGEKNIITETKHKLIKKEWIDIIKRKTEKFVKRALTIHKNKFDYSVVEYRTNKIPVKVICPIHDSFMVRPDAHLFCKSGCPKCKNELISKKLRCSFEDFLKSVKKIHGEKYDYSKVNYINSHKKIEIICLKHGSFFKTPNSHILQSQGCPKCRFSKGEIKIQSFLDNHSICYVFQKKFEDCFNPNTGYKLRFDFYLPTENVLIEYDGRQHYMFGNKFGKFITTEKDLVENQYKDNLKTEYAQKMNIKLLRIKYIDLNKIDDILKKEILRG